MKIRRVYMENIRSHAETMVEFGGGFNCIVGGVGDGKSSILLALHFGLFGERLGRSYDYLLREGQDAGKVTVEFEHAGRNYTITRALRREKGNRISQDMEQLALYESKELLASGKKAAVDEQLKAITGIDEEAFMNVLWVQQEKLKDLLNMEPSKRQQTLDELFRLSDFLNSREALGKFEREYEGEHGAYMKDPDVIGIVNLRSEHSNAHDALLALQLEIENLKVELTQAEDNYKKADETLRRLEDLRKKTEEFLREESSIKARLEGVANEIKRIHEEIEKKQHQIEILQASLSQIKTEIKENRNKLSELGLPPDQSLQELRELKKSFEDKEKGIHAQQGTLKSGLEESDEAKALLEKKSTCPLCQRPLPDDYKNKLLADLGNKQAKDKQELEKLEAELETVGQQRHTLEAIINNLTQATPREEELDRRLAEESKALEDLSTQLKEKQTAQIKLGERLTVISEEISKFDLKQLEEANLVRDYAYQHYAEVKHKLESKEKICEDLTKRVEQLMERLEVAEGKVKRKEKIENLLKTVGDFRDAYKAIGPRLRAEIVHGLTHYVQHVLDDMTAGTGRQYFVEIDETYTPSLREVEHWRDVSLLSGGERTILAFAYKIGLGELIMGARGRTLDLLILDEPTESLGPEDRSIDRLADAVSRLKNIEQIIAVTHSEEFAEKAEHIIRVRKEAERSGISYER